MSNRRRKPKKKRQRDPNRKPPVASRTTTRTDKIPAPTYLPQDRYFYYWNPLARQWQKHTDEAIMAIAKANGWKIQEDTRRTESGLIVAERSGVILESKT